jgi:hypothetical protein
MHPQTADFMALFAGYKKAYGLYTLTGDMDSAGKRKGKAATIKRELTPDHWSQHLRGVQGLGVIPINEENLVRFGAIDVDVYPLDHVELCKKIRLAKFPLVVCATKSSGAHLYCFAKEWVPASLMQAKLMVMAAYLGFGGSEIFPRQTRIIEERGDMGQWINMPYFGDERLGFDDEGQTVLAEDFIRVAGLKQATKLELESLQPPIRNELVDGPPCLNQLCTMGFPPGTRNNGLFCLGVYARKSQPDNWQRLIEEYNNRYMDPPLSPTEVLGVIKSLNKKEFSYTCRQQPIQQYCNKEHCKTMRYGVGNHSGMPILGTLTKVETEPPVWFIEVEGGGRLELSTEDLQSPFLFQKRCIMTLNVMPSLPKRDEWEDIIRRLLQTVTTVQVPKEATPRGQMLAHLEDFLTSRVQGKTHDELVIGKPYTNNNRHYFRMKDFLSYLDRQKFRLLDMNQIAVYLKDIGANKHFFNVKGKGVNCYSVPEFKGQTESLDIPEQAKPPFA